MYTAQSYMRVYTHIHTHTYTHKQCDRRAPTLIVLIETHTLNQLQKNGLMRHRLNTGIHTHTHIHTQMHTFSGKFLSSFYQSPISCIYILKSEKNVPGHPTPNGM